MLCVDKTGTITEPNMEVETILPIAQLSREECDRAVRSFVRNMSPDNETMRTLKKHWNNELPDGSAIRVRRFSSKTKFSAVAFPRSVLVLGAPEILQSKISESIMGTIAKHTNQGKRVLLLGSYNNIRPADDAVFSTGEINSEVQPIALIILNNAVRPHAKETFEYFYNQNVFVKIISGDNPVTAAMAAQEAGIAHAESYVDASLLSDEGLEKAAGEFTVFGRVTPEQKQLLVKALKKQGHTVAMTGDGVNDVLALRDADCGIAIASGSDAAAHAADLVLLNSDFSDMPHIVAEGRRVINNIQRSATLFLSKNIFSFILSLISLISVSLYPFKPSQISLISALMIGIPAFFLALEPNEELIRGKFLRNVLYHAFPAALTAVFVVQWTLLMVSQFEIPPEAASTMCFLLYAFSAYLMLCYACKPFKLSHGIILGTMVLLTPPIDYALHIVFDKCYSASKHTKEFLAKKIHT